MGRPIKDHLLGSGEKDPSWCEAMEELKPCSSYRFWLRIAGSSQECGTLKFHKEPPAPPPGQPEAPPHPNGLTDSAVVATMADRMASYPNPTFAQSQALTHLKDALAWLREGKSQSQLDAEARLLEEKVEKDRLEHLEAQRQKEEKRKKVLEMLKALDEE